MRPKIESGWNYRVVEQTILFHDKPAEKFFTIREVWYDKKGNPAAWSAEPDHPQGDSLDELKQDICWMLSAVLTQPVLKLHEMEAAWRKRERTKSRRSTTAR